MIKLNKNSPETHSFRQKAEDRLRKNYALKKAPPTEAGTMKLIHELEVHQIELQMQNEELQLARDKAEIAREKFNVLYDFAPVGYFTLDGNGSISELNLTGAKMMGNERSALIGHNFRLYVTRESLPEFNDFFRKIFETYSKQICELSLSDHGNPSIYVHIEGACSEDDQKCRLTVVDITKRRRAEDALKESEMRLRELVASKDKLFSIISHDLRSPFSSIIGYSDLLVEQIQENNYSNIGEYAGIIQNASWRVMELLMNLLDWSASLTGRIEFKPDMIDLVVLIDEAVGLSNAAAQKKSLTISRELPDEIPVFADKSMISTVLRNLISNAIKFSSPGGRIVFTAKQEQQDWVISVCDNGVGIDQDVMHKLFGIEAGTITVGTQKEKGTGLGLLLCKEFVRKHKGKIWAESEPGNGSKFHFTVPRFEKRRREK